MRLINSIIVIIVLAMTQQALTQQSYEKILFCYGDLYPEKTTGYDLVVLEPIHFSAQDVTVFKNNNKKVLAYISLGEVNEAARHYEALKGFTLGKNDIWNSHVLDIANQETRAALHTLIAAHIEGKGFDGIFIDNIDNYTQWGPTPKKLAALVEFLSEVKLRFRESVILQNAGLLIMQDTAPYIDAVAVESVATDYNFSTNHYRLRAKKDFKSRLDNVLTVKKQYQKPILLIEYANSKKLTKEVTKRLAGCKLPFVVAQIDLQTVPKSYE
ncbi:hypothetical protein DCS32_14015 [Dokdonia sp. Dokd-P16]|nr:hypothetical protein DCS32_14015 [Dokdonia sp. Dokd-P16]